MTLPLAIDSTLFSVSQWTGTTVPRVAAAFLGLAVCAFVLSAFWHRRARALSTVAALAAGVLLIVAALDPRILHWFGDTTFLTRIRLMMGVVSLVVLVVTLESIRRSHLEERYAVLWITTGLLILICAFFPQVLNWVSTLFGMQYVTAVVAVVFTFLVLVAFHFSIALSGTQDALTKLAQRCALLEARLEALEQGRPPAAPAAGAPAAASEVRDGTTPGAAAPAARRRPGSAVAALLVVGLACAAVLGAGLAAPQARIGVQIYQTLFLLQFLGMAFLLAQSRGGSASGATLLYVLLLASLPMTLIFGVSFHPDVPVAAQALTAFFFLERRRWWLATVFLLFALGMSGSGFAILPPFVAWLFVALGRTAGREGAAGRPFPLRWILSGDRLRVGLPVLLILAAGLWGTRHVLHAHNVIAHHSGDLRNPVNFVIYGGGVLWLALGLGLAGALRRRPAEEAAGAASPAAAPWLAVGLWHLLVTAILWRATPDARFFLPGLAFVLLPVAEQAVRLPGRRLWMPLLVALAVLQSGQVLTKVWRLRQVSEPPRKTIAFLRQHPPSPLRVFMCPEGHCSGRPG